MLPLKAFLASGNYTLLGWPGISRCCYIIRKCNEDKSMVAHLSSLNTGSGGLRDELPNDTVQRIESIMKLILLTEMYFNEILSVLGLSLWGCLFLTFLLGIHWGSIRFSPKMVAWLAAPRYLLRTKY